MFKMQKMKRLCKFFPIVLLILLSLEGSSQQYSKPPKFAVDVFNSIFNAMNDNRTERPTLKLSNDSKEIATRVPKDSEGESVVIIGQLIDSCLITLHFKFGSRWVNTSHYLPLFNKITFFQI